MDSDVLEQLDFNDIKDLANLYEPYKVDFPQVYSFLHNSIKAISLGMNGYVKIYSPRKAWRVDGTFIASIPYYGHDIVAHSLDPSGKYMLDALLETKRFTFLPDLSKPYTLIYAIHEWFYPKILNVVSEHFKQDICYDEELRLFSLPKEKAWEFDLSQCPRDVHVENLKPEDFNLIQKKWHFTWKSADKKLKDLAKLSKGFGVYLKSNGKLVSWVFSTCLGQLGGLQTLDDYKRKGYAKIVVQHMARYLAEQGFDPCATIHPKNVASIEFFEKLGFRDLHGVGFIAVLHVGENLDVVKRSCFPEH